MSTIVATAIAANGKAVHFFPVGGELRPICGRLKGAAESITEVAEDATCAACRSEYKKGDYTLDLGDVAVPEEDELEGAEEDLDEDQVADDEDLDEDEDADEEDERSTSKAQKFAAFAASHGWATRIYVGTHITLQGDGTFVEATNGNVQIRMAWQEGRYQYDASRIIKGKGEMLNALIRNASAARGYVNAISIQEDATKPVLLRRVKSA